MRLNLQEVCLFLNLEEHSKWPPIWTRTDIRSSEDGQTVEMKGLIFRHYTGTNLLSWSRVRNAFVASHCHQTLKITSGGSSAFLLPLPTSAAWPFHVLPIMPPNSQWSTLVQRVSQEAAMAGEDRKRRRAMKGSSHSEAAEYSVGSNYNSTSSPSTLSPEAVTSPWLIARHPTQLLLSSEGIVF